jgi:hypothetical protein
VRDRIRLLIVTILLADTSLKVEMTTSVDPALLMFSSIADSGPIVRDDIAIARHRPTLTIIRSASGNNKAANGISFCHRRQVLVIRHLRFPRSLNMHDAAMPTCTAFC